MALQGLQPNGTMSTAGAGSTRREAALQANRGIARLVGSLFLISNVAFILGAVVFLEPALGVGDGMDQFLVQRAPVTLGALLEILNAVAYLGIAVLMYPVFKTRFESLALGYVSFRGLEFVMQILASLPPLVLLTLSENFERSGAAQAAAFDAMRALLLVQRTWAFQMISVTFGLGALLFYAMLYRSKMVPRLLSAWGLVGAAVVLINTQFDMFGVTLPYLGVIMLLNELTLGVWLIFKGFDASAMLSDPA